MPADESISVLVVDDHSMFTQALTEAFDVEPGMVIAGSASTVAECLEILEHLSVDVVLMGNRLPDGFGGRGAAQVMIAHPGIKMVLVSAGAAESGRVEAARAGCAGYVSKENSLAELTRVIRDAHHGSDGHGARLWQGFGHPGRGGNGIPRGSELTMRELEVLQLLCNGRSNPDICAQLVISPNTLRNHVANLLGKLHVHSKLEAVSVALQGGLIARPGDDLARGAQSP